MKEISASFIICVEIFFKAFKIHFANWFWVIHLFIASKTEDWFLSVLRIFFVYFIQFFYLMLRQKCCKFLHYFLVHLILCLRANWYWAKIFVPKASSFLSLSNPNWQSFVDMKSKGSKYFSIFFRSVLLREFF